MKLKSLRNEPVATLPSVEPRKAIRETPKAVTRMFDFLDLCEEVQPGSSGLWPK